MELKFQKSQQYPFNQKKSMAGRDTAENSCIYANTGKLQAHHAIMCFAAIFGYSHVSTLDTLEVHHIRSPQVVTIHLPPQS
jgi:hypothetical protein